MRTHHAFLLATMVTSIACGGGTPAAKSADDSDEKADSDGIATGKPSSKGHDKGDDKGGDKGSDDTGSAGDTSSAAASDSSGSSDSSSASKPAPAHENAGLDLPKNTDDPWLAAHQMTKKDVMRTMGSLRGKAQGCYKEGKKRDPSVSGEVKIRFVIENGGTVRAWRD